MTPDTQSQPSRHPLKKHRHTPDVPSGCSAFSYHRQNSYLALMGVLMVLLPAEATIVHVLVMRWSSVAAIVLTATSLYALVWMAGNTRAVVLNPLLVDDDTLTVRWGAYFNERIPLSLIDRIQTNEPNVPKHQRMDLGTFGSEDCWIILNEPVAVRGIVGSERKVLAINVSPDDAANFKASVLQGRQKRAGDHSI